MAYQYSSRAYSWSASGLCTHSTKGLSTAQHSIAQHNFNKVCIAHCTINRETTWLEALQHNTAQHSKQTSSLIQLGWEHTRPHHRKRASQRSLVYCSVHINMTQHISSSSTAQPSPLLINRTTLPVPCWIAQPHCASYIAQNVCDREHS